MNRRRPHRNSLWIAAIVSSAALGQQATSVAPDIAYGKDSPSQTIDLYVPARKGFATVVYTYGGGWHSGSGKSSIPIAQKLQSLGYGCVLVSHRLWPPDSFPAQAEDVAAAFAWTKANIAARGGDPERVILAGHSSGAHLSLLLVTDRRFLAQHHLSVRDVAAVIGLSTPLDLSPHQDGHGYGDMLLAGAGAGVFRRDPVMMKDASPAWRLDSALPPTLLLVGQQDFPMLADDARAFVAKAKSLGTNVEFAVIPGKDHMGMALGMVDEKDPVLRQVSAFLERQRPLP